MKGTHFTKPAAGGSVARKIVNPDLLEERAKCNFDMKELYSAVYDKDFARYEPVLKDL
jgi:hypothetical protein